MSVDPGAQEIVIDEHVNPYANTPTSAKKTNPYPSANTPTLVKKKNPYQITNRNPSANTPTPVKKTSPYQITNSSSSSQQRSRGGGSSSGGGGSVSGGKLPPRLVLPNAKYFNRIPDRGGRSNYTRYGNWFCLNCGIHNRKISLQCFICKIDRDRNRNITQRRLVLRLLRKYNKAVNYADGTEAEKHASALAQFPADADNSGSLEIGLFLQKMSTSGGNGIEGLVGYILKFV